MTYCFYHNDLDGHCAGAIVKSMHPDATMIEIAYGYDFQKHVLDKLETSTGNDSIYVVDFRFTTKEFEQLLEDYGIVWIDHHATGINEATKHKAENKDSVYFDIEGIQEIGKAGAQLTWEYLIPHKGVPLAVHYVSKWDVWDHTDPRTIPFNRGLQLTESTDPANETALTMWKELFMNSREGDNRKWNALDQVMNIGVIGEAMKAQYDAFIAKNAYYVADWEGYRTVALNGAVYDSYCIFEHSDKWEALDPQVLVWYQQKADGAWKYSVRNYPGTETSVRAIAEKYNGGGHDKAAGFTSKDLLIQPENTNE